MFSTVPLFRSFEQNPSSETVRRAWISARQPLPPSSAVSSWLRAERVGGRRSELEQLEPEKHISLLNVRPVCI